METMTQKTGTVLVENKSPVGGGFVELFDDGTVLAGSNRDRAVPYGSADEAYATYRPLAQSAWAWNICYALEDYLAGRDDGR